MTARRARPAGVVDLKPVRGADIDEWIMPVTETGCWIWLGTTNSLGYGQRKIAGRTCYIHRLMFERYKRLLQPGEVVMHQCDNPTCCNPDHLAVGSYQDNTQDMIAKRRDRLCGERSHRAKLTADQVIAILNDPRPARVIAAKYGVSKSHVHNLKAGQFWQQLSR